MSSDGDLLPALIAARDMLRDAYWWRRLADPNAAWDQATAQAHIYFDELPHASPGPDHSLAELQLLRPFAIIWADISGGSRWESQTGDFCCAITSGVIVIQLELAVPAEIANDSHAVAVDINRKLGRILRTCDANEPGLLDLSGRPGYLPITAAKISGTIRTDRKAVIEIGDCVSAEIELTWGATLG